MTKTTIKLLAIFAIALSLCAVPANASDASYTLSTTTLGAAITTPAQGVAVSTAVTLASTSTMLSAGSNNQPNTVLWVDRELMFVVTVVDSTHVTVKRAQGTGAGGRATMHANGATVWFSNTQTQGNVISPAPSFFAIGSVASEVAGACTASTEFVLPKIYAFTGNIYDCKRTGAAGTGGQWILVGNGSMGTIGKTANAWCSGTVGSAQTEYANFAACSGSTAENARYIVTAPGTVANFYAFSSTGVTGGSGVDVATLRKNGSDTAITCTFATGGAATTCNDQTHQVTVAVGDILTFKFVTATSDTAANLALGVSIY